MIPLPGRFLAMTVMVFNLMGSCSAQLSDQTLLVQRDMQLHGGAQDPDRTFINTPWPESHKVRGFADEESPLSLAKKKKSKLLSIPFKDMISSINVAIDSLKDSLEKSTREVVHHAAAEMQEAGQQLTNELEHTFHESIQKEIKLANSAEAASLLELGAADAHKPKLEVNATRANATRAKKAKKAKVKLEFNPFKGLIEDINSAIGSIKEGLETSTREVVHQAAADMEKAGRELANDLEQTFHSTIQQEVTTALNAEPASLLALGTVERHKPKLQLAANATRANATRSKKTKLEFKVNATHPKRTKLEFNPFKDMISGINQAIDSIKDNLESSTKQLVHEAAAEMKQAGEEFASGIEQSVKAPLGLV